MAVIYNSLFFDNEAEGNGGGIFVFGEEGVYPRKTDLQLVNSTFADNHAGTSEPEDPNIGFGGGVFVKGNGDHAKSSDAKLVGCILYYNTADKGTFLDRKQIYFDGYTSTEGDDPQTDPIESCIECDRGTQADCVGDDETVICYGEDEPGFADHEGDDYKLASNSICLDEGCRYPTCTNGYKMDVGEMGGFDLAGDDRLTDGELDGGECANNGEEIDMGSYEREECE